MKSEIERNKRRDNEALFNDMAHEVVRQVIDFAEDRLINEGNCEPHEASEVACRAYIETVGDIVKGASWLTEGEAASGAEYFLLKCLGAYTKKPHPFRRRLTATRLRACGIQLYFHTHNYFPRFNAILTQRYTEELHKPDNEILLGAAYNGIFLFAAARLPGVQTQINRELRRRGLLHDAVHVSAFYRDRQMRVIGRAGRPGLSGPH